MKKFLTILLATLTLMLVASPVGAGRIPKPKPDPNFNPYSLAVFSDTNGNHWYLASAVDPAGESYSNGKWGNITRNLRLAVDCGAVYQGDFEIEVQRPVSTPLAAPCVGSVYDERHPDNVWATATVEPTVVMSAPTPGRSAAVPRQISRQWYPVHFYSGCNILTGSPGWYDIVVPANTTILQVTDQEVIWGLYTTRNLNVGYNSTQGWYSHVGWWWDGSYWNVRIQMRNQFHAITSARSWSSAPGGLVWSVPPTEEYRCR